MHHQRLLRTRRWLSQVFPSQYRNHNISCSKHSHCRPAMHSRSSLPVGGHHHRGYREYEKRLENTSGLSPLHSFRPGSCSRRHSVHLRHQRRNVPPPSAKARRKARASSLSVRLWLVVLFRGLGLCLHGSNGNYLYSGVPKTIRSYR